jgi:hypothetical protein
LFKRSTLSLHTHSVYESRTFWKHWYMPLWVPWKEIKKMKSMNGMEIFIFGFDFDFSNPDFILLVQNFPFLFILPDLLAKLYFDFRLSFFVNGNFYN